MGTCERNRHSTLLVAGLHGGRLVVANAGDCRALLLTAKADCGEKAEAGRRGAQWWDAQHACGDETHASSEASCHCDRLHALPLSEDHKPDRDRERRRIEAAGGHVSVRHGVARVEGLLAVSRSLGDADLKRYVVATPDVRQRLLDGTEVGLLLASDGERRSAGDGAGGALVATAAGFWDVFTNEDAAATTLRVRAHPCVVARAATHVCCSWCGNACSCSRWQAAPRDQAPSSWVHWRRRWRVR